MYRTIKKYWGIEDWIQVTPDYAFKRLSIKKGLTLLNHYHNVKEETFYIASGTGIIIIDGISNKISTGDTFHIIPKSRHQVEAITDLIILEASTPYLDDSIREVLICL